MSLTISGLRGDTGRAVERRDLQVLTCGLQHRGVLSRYLVIVSDVNQTTWRDLAYFYTETFKKIEQALI